jgi:hypothetical protein
MDGKVRVGKETWKKVKNGGTDTRVNQDGLRGSREEVEAGDPALLVGGARLGVQAH